MLKILHGTKSSYKKQSTATAATVPITEMVALSHTTELLGKLDLLDFAVVSGTVDCTTGVNFIRKTYVWTLQQ